MNDDQSLKQRLLRSHVLSKGSINDHTYEIDDSFRPYDPENPLTVHTTFEMLHALERDPHAELEARIFCKNGDGKYRLKHLNASQFKESFRKDLGKRVCFKESDAFAMGFEQQGAGGLLGNDFVPLLGGPFYKNLYYYTDYIRMHSLAFYAFHHDPVARAAINITRDFVLGTGYEVQCDTHSNEGKVAMAAWKAFEEANQLQEQIDHLANEISIYGEVMIWELPGNQTKITYQLPRGDLPPVGIIPRVRLIDPSNIVEIVTYPEDITRPLFYVWLTPTQYQIYGGGQGTGPGNPSSAPLQPSVKFIYQQIPANQMMHFKINSVSNEKRGRSDLFPVLGYLKRLRDSVEYTLINLQKTTAWSIDTEIDGSQADIDAYVANAASLGTIPPAGSEHVHSKAVKRNYLGNSHAGGHTSDAFDWCMSMICAGVQIPLHYFGMHLSGGQTRASAIVGTEPVAKKMEKRREKITRVLKCLWNLCQTRAGIPDVQCNVIFPEIITQDRSQKLKDILLAEEARWIKPERAATMAAKELQIQNYNYQVELENITDQLPEVPKPLLDPSKSTLTNQTDPEQDQSAALAQGSALTGQDRKDIKNGDSQL